MVALPLVGWTNCKSPDNGGLWRLQSMFDEGPKDSTGLLFQEKLLDNMHDAVVFVDRNCKILLWNRGAERLTGIASAASFQQPWVPGLIGCTTSMGVRWATPSARCIMRSKPACNRCDGC